MARKIRRKRPSTKKRRTSKARSSKASNARVTMTVAELKKLVAASAKRKKKSRKTPNLFSSFEYIEEGEPYTYGRYGTRSDRDETLDTMIEARYGDS